MLILENCILFFIDLLSASNTYLFHDLYPYICVYLLNGKKLEQVQIQLPKWWFASKVEARHSHGF
jgi:hypothetical protein